MYDGIGRFALAVEDEIDPVGPDFIPKGVHDMPLDADGPVEKFVLPEVFR